MVDQRSRSVQKRAQCTQKESVGNMETGIQERRRAVLQYGDVSKTSTLVQSTSA